MGFLNELADVLDATCKAIDDAAKKKQQLMHDAAELFLKIVDGVYDEGVIEERLRHQLQVINPGDRRVFLQELMALKDNQRNCWAVRDVVIRVAARML